MPGLLCPVKCVELSSIWSLRSDDLKLSSRSNCAYGCITACPGMVSLFKTLGIEQIYILSSYNKFLVKPFRLAVPTGPRLTECAPKGGAETGKASRRSASYTLLKCRKMQDFIFKRPLHYQELYDLHCSMCLPTAFRCPSLSASPPTLGLSLSDSEGQGFFQHWRPASSVQSTAAEGISFASTLVQHK